MFVKIKVNINVNIIDMNQLFQQESPVQSITSGVRCRHEYSRLAHSTRLARLGHAADLGHGGTQQAGKAKVWHIIWWRLSQGTGLCDIMWLKWCLNSSVFLHSLILCTVSPNSSQPGAGIPLSAPALRSWESSHWRCGWCSSRESFAEGKFESKCWRQYQYVMVKSMVSEVTFSNNQPHDKNC